MKTLKEFINESINNIINQLAEEINKLDKENLLKDFKDKELNYNIADKMITFIGNKNEDIQAFDDKVFTILHNCKTKQNGLSRFRKVNQEKQPVVYIGLKDYLESIKKDLEN